MPSDPLADARDLGDIYEAGLVWHCVCAVARLHVPDHLAGGPLSMRQLAAGVDVDQHSLFRVMRLLADHGLFTLDGDTAALADRGRLLCRQHPLSMWATFASVGPPDVAHALVDTLRTGEAAARHVLGADFWDYLAAHPQQQAVFDEQMRQQAEFQSLPCVPVLRWPTAGTIADVGGGTGTLLAAVLDASPGISGILVDQPHVLEEARRYLRDRDVADRCGLHAGDLFTPAPRADMYLLGRVLHDWADDDALRILDAVGRGAGDDARLRIFELLVPDDGRPHRSKMSDIAMLLLFGGGRERTETDFRDLLDRTGWRLDTIVACPGTMSVLEASRRPPGDRA